MWFCWLFAKFSKQNHRHTCMHMHTSTPCYGHKNTFFLPLHLCFNSTVFLGLTDWVHMQQHVLWVSSPSSKHTANRTDRKYVLFSQSTGLESLAGLFKVFPQSLWRFLRLEKKKSYFAAYLFSCKQTECNSLFTRDKTLYLSHGKRLKNKNGQPR